ncbi:hypothetical protein HIM_01502 [Hirsutella minnesotensis 3608]|nr:hypothetical protein HIM_01502 [Hirsutella minnesotensis 3608]
MSGGWNTTDADIHLAPANHSRIGCSLSSLELHVPYRLSADPWGDPQGVFTSLVENLGVKEVQFEELLTLDASELAALQPLYGVIFLFKYPTDRPYASADGPLDGAFDHGAAERIFFAAQTIQNACATQALLSVLLNKAGDVDVGAHLRDFRDFTLVLPPEFRGEALSNSDLIREVHNGFARSSPFVDETQRGGDAEDAFHFIAYTPIRFNLLAVCRDLRVRAREFGDDELLEREERKRRDWLFENALRRHNFVGFAGEVLKGVVRAKLDAGGDQAVDAWVAESLERRRTAETAARMRAGGQGDGDVEME